MKDYLEIEDVKALEILDSREIQLFKKLKLWLEDIAQCVAYGSIRSFYRKF